MSEPKVLEKRLYTAVASATNGREGRIKSDDGTLDLPVSPPKAMGGNGAGTNPEQLFAAGYSACFIGAMKAVAGRQKIALPGEVSIKSSVSIGPMTGKEGAFGIAVKMEISVPGMDRAAAEKLVATAHEVCPYSNATRGNIDVQLSIA